MYIKKIKSINFVDGTETERPYYFNLSKAELMEMELSTDGGLKSYIERIVETKKTPELVALFKKLILMAYGERSDDGMRFIKTRPDGSRLADEFAQTDAYSELFMELATNEQAAIEFINGIIPAQLQAQLTAEQGSNPGHAYPAKVGQ